MKRDPEIYCPKCGYRPKAEDRWSCEPGCGAVWHTFWTGGVCPGCTYAWPVTDCPSCTQTSPHRQWYHLPVDEPAREKEEELEPEDSAG
jgi:hypothetical protein